MALLRHRARAVTSVSPVAGQGRWLNPNKGIINSPSAPDGDPFGYTRLPNALGFAGVLYYSSAGFVMDPANDTVDMYVTCRMNTAVSVSIMGNSSNNLRLRANQTPTDYRVGAAGGAAVNVTNGVEAYPIDDSWFITGWKCLAGGGVDAGKVLANTDPGGIISFLAGAGVVPATVAFGRGQATDPTFIGVAIDFRVFVNGTEQVRVAGDEGSGNPVDAFGNATLITPELAANDWQVGGQPTQSLPLPFPPG